MSSDNRKDPYGFQTLFGMAFGQPSADPEIRRRQQIMEWASGGKRDFEKMHYDYINFAPRVDRDTKK